MIFDFMHTYDPMITYNAVFNYQYLTTSKILNFYNSSMEV